MAVPGVPGVARLGEGGGLESVASLSFLAQLTRQTRGELGALLRRRREDREFIDLHTRACVGFNRTIGAAVADGTYETVISHEDASGRVVIGPKSGAQWTMGCGEMVAAIPEFLSGDHVTLFGPPGDAKVCINAMNSLHRKLDGEPSVVEELLRTARGPKWGADDEDSKTPLSEDLVRAGENLAGCLSGSLRHVDPTSGRVYQLADDGLALPIKRIPGLALPCSFLLCDGDPVPLHLYDLALHLYQHWADPQALAFYIPKLENEEEAQYVHDVIARAEGMIAKQHSRYRLGSVRVLVVLESARAVFRINEIIDALHPHFAGASLGWHDFLASTARVMKEDPNYRIPLKADPDIVINNIRESHDLLARTVKARGGIAIGGMYGVLPSEARSDSESFQVAITGFIRDVVAQMKRGLMGFWVAHPDFVRLGIALVEGWRRRERGEGAAFDALIDGLVVPSRLVALRAFIEGPDVAGLDRNDARYPRAILAADGRARVHELTSDESEVRYNIFQTLQYLADWLSGNGCVALPATIDGIDVRVMDDLATCERSRWEVWHEVHHGRLSTADFVRIIHEELRFIQRGDSAPGKRVQVAFDERTRRWYPVAAHLTLKLMSDARPVEFASELLMPFTIESIRAAADPLAAATALDEQKFALGARVGLCHEVLSACCARVLAERSEEWAVIDPRDVARVILAFTAAEVSEAGEFHGDIGQASATLDPLAAAEQAGVVGADTAVREQLHSLGEKYKKRFGFKFLAAAKGFSAIALLSFLRERLENSPETELASARTALATIALARLTSGGRSALVASIEEARVRFKVRGASVAILCAGGGIQELAFGVGAPGRPVTASTNFEIASLSKPIASCIAMEALASRGIMLSTRVNELLARIGSAHRIESRVDAHPEWADLVTIEHLLRHEALSMHYIEGTPANGESISVDARLSARDTEGRAAIGVIAEPGCGFRYSGGGFLVLEHILTRLTERSSRDLIDAMLGPCESHECAWGFRDDGEMVEGTRKEFPLFAAGILTSAGCVARFLARLACAHARVEGAAGISHDTAVRMLHGIENGSGAFMGCMMGLGIFTIEAGPNRLCVHHGANDGFRSLFVHCYRGPDAGKGVVVLCNGDAAAVEFVTESARAALGHLAIKGVDFARLDGAEVAAGSAMVPEHERVNAEYRDRLFGAFSPDFPEVILARGAVDPLSPWNRAVGASIVEVTNQRFARADNLVSPYLPIFDPGLFGSQGKVMDSWETSRHSERGREWLVIDITQPTAIDLITVSTQFHLGNHAPWIMLDGWCVATKTWHQVLPRSALDGHTIHVFDAVSGTREWARFRISIEPDGGVSRLGFFGADLPAAERALLVATRRTRWPPFSASTPRPLVPHCDRAQRTPSANDDLACAAFGGRVVSVSNEHFGPAVQVISPYPPLHMYDGLESARSREPGHSEQVVIALARPARLGRIEFDFTHFVNNAPREAMVEGLALSKWIELLPRTLVKPYAGNVASFVVTARDEVSQIRVTAFPDGGINRIRAYASP